MTITNIRQEGAAMKQAEPVRQFGETIGGRQIDPLGVGQSLVTLMPKGVAPDPLQGTMIEQFRLLRSRVKALSKDFQLRTILITSALPGEGKTTVAANLAGSLSDVEGLRVLLMDFDLRKPALHTIFGATADRHQPSGLAGEVAWRDAVYQVNRRLDVLFGFHALEDPDRLLQSARLEKLMEEAKAEYDVVVLDSAPMLAVADTHALVPLVDCGLFVLNADTTPLAAAREALAMLRDKVAGCVVNRVRHLKSDDYYRGSGYGYGYGTKRKED